MYQKIKTSILLFSLLAPNVVGCRPDIGHRINHLPTDSLGSPDSRDPNATPFDSAGRELFTPEPPPESTSSVAEVFEANASLEKFQSFWSAMTLVDVEDIDRRSRYAPYFEPQLAKPVAQLKDELVELTKDDGRIIQEGGAREPMIASRLQVAAWKAGFDVLVAQVNIVREPASLELKYGVEARAGASVNLAAAAVSGQVSVSAERTEVRRTGDLFHIEVRYTTRDGFSEKVTLTEESIRSAFDYNHTLKTFREDDGEMRLLNESDFLTAGPSLSWPPKVCKDGCGKFSLGKSWAHLTLGARKDTEADAEWIKTQKDFDFMMSEDGKTFYLITPTIRRAIDYVDNIFGPVTENLRVQLEVDSSRLASIAWSIAKKNAEAKGIATASSVPESELGRLFDSMQDLNAAHCSGSDLAIRKREIGAKTDRLLGGFDEYEYHARWLAGARDWERLLKNRSLRQESSLPVVAAAEQVLASYEKACADLGKYVLLINLKKEEALIRAQAAAQRKSAAEIEDLVADLHRSLRAAEFAAALKAEATVLSDGMGQAYLFYQYSEGEAWKRHMLETRDIDFMPRIDRSPDLSTSAKTALKQAITEILQYNIKKFDQLVAGIGLQGMVKERVKLLTPKVKALRSDLLHLPEGNRDVVVRRWYQEVKSREIRWDQDCLQQSVQLSELCWTLNTPATDDSSVWIYADEHLGPIEEAIASFYEDLGNTFVRRS